MDPIHIDQIWRGQDATVLFPAFTQRTTPIFGGRVLRVAADASEDARTGLSWYEIEVSIGPAIESDRDLSAPAWVRDAWETMSAWVERTSGEAVAWLSEQELAPARLRAFLSGIVEDVPREEASSLPERDASPARSTHAGELAISAGMPAEIHLRTGERSPLSYFLKPLTDYFSRALREE